VNVAYDFVRSESTGGRGKLKKNEDRALAGKGDCIDCKLCVHVCPMGIDIRNGVQLECTNCTACIDECNTVMSSIGFPKGLIRYATEDEIRKKEPFKFTGRMKGYTAVLGILIGILAGLLLLRNDMEATILRLPGQLFQHEGTKITNVYTYKVVNKTVHDFDKLEFRLLSHEGTVERVGSPTLDLKGQGFAQGTLFIKIESADLTTDKTKLRIGLFDGDNLLETSSTTFLGPRTFN